MTARILEKEEKIRISNVYLIFPIENVCSNRQMQIFCKTALKNWMMGPLSADPVFRKPNHLYVKIPSDEISLQMVDDKAVEKTWL